MTEIRCMRADDEEFWFRLDKHLPKEEFLNKVREKRGYVLSSDGVRAGLLRYGLFWDNTPFCNLLFIERDLRGKGFGRALMEYWENDMRSRGYKMLLTSTQTDESAQHFYRKIGFKDCGGFVIEGFAQPMELFLYKAIP